MEKHPQFDLWLHDDRELAEALGSPLTERTTIHLWQLSLVQRLRTAAGGHWIYKVQAPPTVEPEFYRVARSPLLVSARPLSGGDPSVALLLEEVDGRSLGEGAMSAQEAREAAASLLRGIAAIQGDLPARADIRGPERWNDRMEGALGGLADLVAQGVFHTVTPELISRLGALARSPSVLDAVRSPAGYVHSDLKAENVLVLRDGTHRVLDWQRPIRGPVALDAATLFISLGLDPTAVVPPGIVQLYHLLLIAWFTESAQRWFPQGRPHYDRMIATIAQRVLALKA